MFLNYKRTLASLACIGLLAGCGSEEEEDYSDRLNVETMTAVVEGYQTFQQRASVFDSSAGNTDESIYIYKNSETDDSEEVVFYSTHTSLGKDTEELIVSDATDINGSYTVFHIDDAISRVNGKNYFGDVVFVQDKKSGVLFPVANGSGEPISSSYVTDSMYWIGNDRFANNADEDRIYLNDTAKGELYIYEFDFNNFQLNYIYTLDYNGDSFWINEAGDILRQDSAENDIFYLHKQGKYDFIDRQKKDFHGEVYLPFLYDGKFYAAMSGEEDIYYLSEGLSPFDFIESKYWTNNASYKPATNAARHGVYEMSSDCKLYEFDETLPLEASINLVSEVDELELSDGALAVAGQDALFCVYSDGGEAAILKYDIEEAQASTYTASEGSLSDATNYFTVISDTEVMFSESPSGTFNEYYIDLESEKTTAVEVDDSSLIFLQRLDN